MKVGSLFSGYGGLDLAVGGDLAWYCEIEPAACTVMEAHHPGVPNLGDITAVDWFQVEPVDVITGGYPCQPFSNAGMRKGTKDERHLWPYVRDALCAIRPRYAVLENVRGHLTLGFDVVLADLADLGWSARWGVVRASDAGAPHNRARIFIVVRHPGHDAGGSERGQQSASATSGTVESGSRLAYPEREGLQGQPWTWLGWASEPAKSGDDAAHTQGSERGPAESDDLQARGAAEPGERPSVASNPSGERYGGGQGPAGVGGVGGPSEGSRRQTSATRQEPGAGSAQSVSDPNSGLGNGRGSQVARIRPKLNQQEDTQPSRVSGLPETNWGQYAPAIDRWQRTIGRPAPAPTIRRAGRDRLNPAFVEWMMGLPEGWVTGHGLSASQELKMLGNGVVPQQARLALELLGGVA